MNPVCFLDMDGVLADFTTAMERAHAREFTSLLTEDGPLPFEMEQYWGITPGEFWSPANEPGFWENIPPFEHTVELVLRLEQVFDKRLVILSSPSAALAACIEGKRNWLQTHLPWVAQERRFFFGPHKHLLASYNTLLIDDYDRNVQMFMGNGGHAMLFAQPWNRGYNFIGDKISASVSSAGNFVRNMAKLDIVMREDEDA